MEETKGIATVKPTLPKLEDLHHDVEIAFKNDELNLLLNQKPPKAWVKQHPMVKKEILNAQGQKIKVPSEYIAIDMIELLLTRIFQQWRVEILREGVMFQSVFVTVRLHYLNPTTNTWLFHDGVGAVGVQTDAGKNASDLGAIKAAAVQMALPAAESYAVKDAAEKIGKLFGKDLNRQHAIDFTMAYSNFGENTPPNAPENPKATPEAPTGDLLATKEQYDYLITLLDDSSLKEELNSKGANNTIIKTKAFKAKIIEMFTGNKLLGENAGKYISLMQNEIEFAKSAK